MPCSRCGCWALHGYWTIGSHYQGAGRLHRFWVVECLPSCEVNTHLLSLQALWNEHQLDLTSSCRKDLEAVILQAHRLAEQQASKENARRRAVVAGTARESAAGEATTVPLTVAPHLPDFLVDLRHACLQ